ncbi:MAG TPA: RluA family pseudouridine synthase [Saprospiraceae bacterium]|nr:RluA family pseudouridine synthase [Saprospiraceae bacterium]HMQ83281.1 RluA family pseudouridine synthase [Saprospiraceae bacterium]
MTQHKPDIIFQDEHLLVASKPPGLLSIPDRFAPEKPNLMAQLNAVFGKVWVVHRLDRETSGLLCWALTEEAHKSLSLQFQNRETEKHYLALVDGRPASESGEIRQAIGEHPTIKGKMCVIKSGKPALTYYQVIQYFRQFSLIDAKIETGRTHQIRVHLESIGHPLAVDPLYGQRSAFFLSEIKQKGYQLGKFQEEKALMERLSLHAWKLKLKHPATEEEMSFEAPLPKDFRAVLNQLEKWGR